MFEPSTNQVYTAEKPGTTQKGWFTEQIHKHKIMGDEPYDSGKLWEALSGLTMKQYKYLVALFYQDPIKLKEEIKSLL